MSLQVRMILSVSRVLTACRFRVADDAIADLCSDLVPKITCQVGARAYLPPLASNTLLVPSRLAFLQRSASGTVMLRLS